MQAQTTPTQITNDARPNQEVKLFLSHMPEDVEAATEIGRHMRFLGKPRLQVFPQEGVPGPRDHWLETKAELYHADKLILLYTDPDQNWQSLMYQSGFFECRHFSDSKRRPIILHDESIHLPTPLPNFQSVKVSNKDREPLQEFLREIYATQPWEGAPPINPELMSETFKEYREKLEKAIIDAVCGPQETRVFARELHIEMLEKDFIAAEEFKLPSQAKVWGSPESLSLFNLRDRRQENGRDRRQEYGWDETLREMASVSDHTGDWVRSLKQMMKLIVDTNQRIHSTGLPLYCCKREDVKEIYRPAIRSFRRKKGTLSFKVVFVDLPKETTVEPAGESTILFQALITARMFRYGIIKRLDEKIKELMQKRDSETITNAEWFKQSAALLQQFFGQKLTVLVESINRGYGRKDLLSCFDGEQHAQLVRIFKEWDDLCETTAPNLLQRCNDGSVEDREIADMTEKSLELNKELMQLCAGRFHLSVQKQ